jgi:hypothetical protein
MADTFLGRQHPSIRKVCVDCLALQPVLKNLVIGNPVIGNQDFKETTVP